MTSEEYRKAAEDVIYLVSCAVNDIAPDPVRVKEMNIPLLYDVAEFHMLTALTAMELESAGVHDTDFKQAMAKAIRKAALMDTDMQALSVRLNDAGIWYLPLKGMILKDFYPGYGMRQMSDRDILFDADRADDVKDIMENLGYTVKFFDAGIHDSYFKQPVCRIEMHRTLFGIEQPAVFRKYYKNIKDRMVRDEGNSCAYHLTPEDFYIYIIAHEYKHFTDGGTGLRSLLDTYVYLRRVPLDMTYVGAEMEKLGIADFEAANRSLAMHLFSGEPLTSEEYEMLDYILSSGTFGTLKNGVQLQIHEKGRWGYFLSQMTPPYYFMKQLYPVLDKAPVLYPFCWAYRLIHSFFFCHKSFMYKVKAVLTWKR